MWRIWRLRLHALFRSYRSDYLMAHVARIVIDNTINHQFINNTALTLMATEISHGRGGAGNIDVDDTKYVDGEVVRSGDVGSHGDGAYSAGRGGAGNITDIGTTSSPRKDTDFVPEAAVRASQDVQGYHTGRGGAGNEHHAEEHPDAKPRPVAPVGLADKLKTKLFGAFKH
ncbi:hypothetical protein THARTR1_06368 [Trichoderma harzianum]|uniref:Uncharacterized protein n=1 Tax=Trichoderma harzianum TaxID=5544 RepID=A0A2K0U5U0_TRIHA|nr:hypothetical protein THARTR1_06368 [Trichoderma harzianum]